MAGGQWSEKRKARGEDEGCGVGGGGQMGGVFTDRLRNGCRGLRSKWVMALCRKGR